MKAWWDDRFGCYRDTGTGHRLSTPGHIGPVETRRLAWYGLKPWVGVWELRGRAQARAAA